MLLLYDTIAAKTGAAAHGADGYYFVENGSFFMFELSDVVHEVLIETGHVKVGSTGPTPFSPEEQKKFSPVRCVPFHYRFDRRLTRPREAHYTRVGWEHAMQVLAESSARMEAGEDRLLDGPS